MGGVAAPASVLIRADARRVVLIRAAGWGRWVGAAGRARCGARGAAGRGLKANGEAATTSQASPLGNWIRLERQPRPCSAKGFSSSDSVPGKTPSSVALGPSAGGNDSVIECGIWLLR